MNARLLALLPLAVVTGCATQGSKLPAEKARDPMAEVRDAARTRDLQRLRRLRTSASADPKVTTALAIALYWTAGVDEAKTQTGFACHDDRLLPHSKERATACAILAFDELAAGKPLNQVRAGGRGAFLDQQKLMIAMVAVNGNPAEPFIVDTGAPMTVISKRYADRVKLPYRADVGERSQHTRRRSSWPHASSMASTARAP